MRGPIGAVLAMVLLGSAAPASGYVRTRASGGGALSWRAQPRLHETAATLGDLDAATVRAAVQQAMAAWSFPAVACTSMQMEYVTGGGAPAVVAPDRTSSLIFRETSWCTTMPCRDPQLLAQTTVFARSRPGQPDDGEIIDVDLEINAWDHRWTVIPEGGPSPIAGARDFGNVLTHELGHLLGLDHVCATPGALPARDHLGTLVPACAMAPATVREATMFPDESTPGDTTRRTLAADDVLGVCEIYPRPAGDAGRQMRR